MKLMLNPKRVLSCLLPMLFLAFSACEKDDPIEPEKEKPEIPEPPQQVDLITLKVNSFVVANMYDAYLWDDQLPDKSSLDIRYENNPFELLDTLIYDEFDPWTYLSDNADQSQEELDGEGKTFGYSLYIYKFTDEASSLLFGIIKYVYPGSPAEKAGLKRGDILMQINNVDITLDNYMQLFYGDNLTLTLGKISNRKIILSDNKISMQSIKMVLNPLVADSIIEVDEHKVGYLCYTDYLNNSHEKLATCLQGFKDAGITDMVLDLRYNPGGYAITSTYLSSMLAPAAKVNAKELLLKHIWNDKYMKLWKKDELETRFNSEVPVKLDLPRLYVLTTDNTASASESTIIGLKAHMDVIQIGTNTGGKYCGAYPLRPVIDKEGTLDKDIENWMLMIIVYKFANKD